MSALFDREDRAAAAKASAKPKPKPKPKKKPKKVVLRKGSRTHAPKDSPLKSEPTFSTSRTREPAKSPDTQDRLDELGKQRERLNRLKEGRTPDTIDRRETARRDRGNRRSEAVRPDISDRRAEKQIENYFSGRGKGGEKLDPLQRELNLLERAAMQQPYDKNGRLWLARRFGPEAARAVFEEQQKNAKSRDARLRVTFDERFGEYNKTIRDRMFAAREERMKANERGFLGGIDHWFEAKAQGVADALEPGGGLDQWAGRRLEEAKEGVLRFPETVGNAGKKSAALWEQINKYSFTEENQQAIYDYFRSGDFTDDAKGLGAEILDKAPEVGAFMLSALAKDQKEKQGGPQTSLAGVLLPQRIADVWIESAKQAVMHPEATVDDVKTLVYGTAQSIGFIANAVKRGDWQALGNIVGGLVEDYRRRYGDDWRQYAKEDPLFNLLDAFAVANLGARVVTGAGIAAKAGIQTKGIRGVREAMRASRMPEMYGAGRVITDRRGDFFYAPVGRSPAARAVQHTYDAISKVLPDNVPFSVARRVEAGTVQAIAKQRNRRSAQIRALGKRMQRAGANPITAGSIGNAMRTIISRIPDPNAGRARLFWESHVPAGLRDGNRGLLMILEEHKRMIEDIYREASVRARHGAIDENAARRIDQQRNAVAGSMEGSTPPVAGSFFEGGKAKKIEVRLTPEELTRVQNLTAAMAELETAIAYTPNAKYLEALSLVEEITQIGEQSILRLTDSIVGDGSRLAELMGKAEEVLGPDLPPATRDIIIRVARTEEAVADRMAYLRSVIDPKVKIIFDAIRDDPLMKTRRGAAGARHKAGRKQRPQQDPRNRHMRGKQAPSTEMGDVVEPVGDRVRPIARTEMQALEKDMERAWLTIYNLGRKEGADPRLRELADLMDEYNDLQELWDANIQDVDVVFGGKAPPGWGFTERVETVVDRPPPPVQRTPPSPFQAELLEGADARNWRRIQFQDSRSRLARRVFASEMGPNDEVLGRIPHRMTADRRSTPTTGGANVSTGTLISTSDQSALRLGEYNNLYLFEHGLLDANPDHLIRHVETAITIEAMDEARGALLARAEPLTPARARRLTDDDIIIKTRGADYHFTPAMRDRVKSTGTEKEIAESLMDAAEDYAKAVVADSPADARALGWIDDNGMSQVGDLMVVSKKQAKRLFRHLGGQQARQQYGFVGPATASVDLVSNIIKVGVMYSNPGYYAANFVGNLAFLALHQGPLMVRNLQRTAAMSVRNHDLYLRIANETGDGAAGAVLAMTKGAGKVGEALSATQLVARGANALVDRKPRVAAWLHEAARRGYKTDAQIKALLDKAANEGLNGPARRIADDIQDAAQRAMVDFDRMTPFEKQFIRRIVFVYPWIRGSLNWAKDYAIDFPERAAVAAQFANMTHRQSEENLGEHNLPSWLKGSYVIGNDGVIASISNAAGASPLGTAGDIVDVGGWVTGQGVFNRTVGDMLNPLFSVVWNTLNSKDPFGNDTTMLDAAYQNIIGILPGALRKALRGESGVYVDGSWGAWLARQSRGILEFDIDLAEAQKRWEFEQIKPGQKRTVDQKAQSRITNLQAEVGAGVEIPPAIKQAVVLKTKYDEERERIKDQYGVDESTSAMQVLAILNVLEEAGLLKGRVEPGTKQNFEKMVEDGVKADFSQFKDYLYGVVLGQQNYNQWKKENE